MKTKAQLLVIFAMTSLTALSACARSPETATPTTAPVATTEAPVVDAIVAAPAAPSPAAAKVDPGLPSVVVHKNANCGCCVLWVEHMQAAGFAVEVRNADNLEPVKSRLGVPLGKGSCHTAEVGGYFVEGHVPADDIKQLLAQKPEAKGLVLPGMPLGSPGMEIPDGRTQPYTVELVGNDGTTTAFAQH